MNNFLARKSTTIKSIEACKARRFCGRSNPDFKYAAILDRVLKSGEPDHEIIERYRR